MFPPVGFGELLMILGTLLGVFFLAFIFRLLREGWWRFKKGREKQRR